MVMVGLAPGVVVGVAVAASEELTSGDGDAVLNVGKLGVTADSIVRNGRHVCPGSRGRIGGSRLNCAGL